MKVNTKRCGCLCKQGTAVTGEDQRQRCSLEATGWGSCWQLVVSWWWCSGLLLRGWKVSTCPSASPIAPVSVGTSSACYGHGHLRSPAKVKSSVHGAEEHQREMVSKVSERAGGGQPGEGMAVGRPHFALLELEGSLCLGGEGLSPPPPASILQPSPDAAAQEQPSVQCRDAAHSLGCWAQQVAVGLLVAMGHRCQQCQHQLCSPSCCPWLCHA